MYDLSAFPSLGRQIHQTYQAVKTRLEANLKAQGLKLSSEQFRLLMILFWLEGSTQAELAKDMASNKTAVTRLLDDLQAQGLIERRTDPKDRRAKRIYLSPEGRALEPALEDAARRTSEAAREGIDDPELHRLFEQLELIRNNLAEPSGT